MSGLGGIVSGGLGLAKSVAGGKGGGKGGSSGSGSDPAQAEWAYMEDLNKIRSRYADLGLGGSTMEAMDEGGAALGAEANQQQLDLQNQQAQTQMNASNVSSLTQLANLNNQQQGTSGFNAGFNATPASTAAVGPGTGTLT